MAGRPLTRARNSERVRARTIALTDNLADVLEAAINATQAAISRNDSHSARDYAACVAILADRYHLRSGLPTSSSVQLDADKLANEITEAIKDEVPDPKRRERIALRLVTSPAAGGQEPPQRLDSNGTNGAKATAG